MTMTLRITFAIFVLFVYFVSFVSNINFENALLWRRKRTLVYQPGLNWVQMVAGAGIPVDIKGYSITFGPVVKSYFALPDNSSYYTDPTITIQRKKRAITSRWKIYSLIADMLNKYSLKDGKACILHAICEAASIPFDLKSGLFAEIMHILLTPSTTKESVDNQNDNDYISAEKLGKTEHCNTLYPECSIQLTQIFTAIHQII